MLSKDVRVFLGCCTWNTDSMWGDRWKRGIPVLPLSVTSKRVFARCPAFPGWILWCCSGVWRKRESFDLGYTHLRQDDAITASWLGLRAVWRKCHSLLIFLLILVYFLFLSIIFLHLCLSTIFIYFKHVLYYFHQLWLFILGGGSLPFQILLKTVFLFQKKYTATMNMMLIILFEYWKL